MLWTFFAAVHLVLRNYVAGKTLLLSNFDHASRDFLVRIRSTFCTTAVLRRKCRSVFQRNTQVLLISGRPHCNNTSQHQLQARTLHNSCFVEVCHIADDNKAKHPPFEETTSNSCFVEVCHVADDNKSIFCFHLIIIVLSLPYSLDILLHDQELRQHSNFKTWADFNLQIQRDEPGK